MVYILPGMFCTMRLINDPGYLHRDKNCGKLVTAREVKKYNPVFVEADVCEKSVE